MVDTPHARLYPPYFFLGEQIYPDKHIDTSPRFLAVDLQQQLLPGTFEYAMNHLIDYELDLTQVSMHATATT
jgi:hypothetical protein